MRILRAAGTATPTPPSRAYAFLATSLGTFVLCLTLWSIANINSSRPDKRGVGETETLAGSVATPDGASASPAGSGGIPHDQLGRFGILAVMAGVVAAIPRRVPPLANQTEPTLDLAEVLGVPVLASLFPTAATPHSRAAQKHTTSGIARIIFLAEIMICTAFIIAMLACYQQRPLARSFIQQPFDAYASAIKTTVQGVESLLQSDSDAATTKSRS